MALRAEPFERVERTFRARHFNHHPDRICRPLWRMPHMLGQKKNVAFFDRNFKRGFPRLLHDAQRNVPLQLIEEFLCWIVVMVATLVRAADYWDHHLAVFPYLSVTHRRLKLLLVRLDPRLKIKGLQILDRRHAAYYCNGL